MAASLFRMKAFFVILASSYTDNTQLLKYIGRMMCYIRGIAQEDFSLSACLRLPASYSISRRANNVGIDFQKGPAPPDFKMYTPFNPFCLCGIVGGTPD